LFLIALIFTYACPSQEGKKKGLTVWQALDEFIVRFSQNIIGSPRRNSDDDYMIEFSFSL
jgi:hypothetical protein